MPDPAIIRVANPAALDLPEINDLLTEAFATNADIPPETALSELRRILTSPNVALFLAREGENYVSMALVFVPTTRFSSAVQVYHIFNRGGRRTLDALADAVVDITRKNGYDAIETVNTDGRDMAFARLFGKAATPTIKGTLFRFEIDGG